MTPQELKNSILQLAIQGKLVEQLPLEGTAEELFAQIQQEKQRLIAEKKIKKEKPLPKITEDEKPFDIPESWKWVHLNYIASSSLGKTLDKAKNTGDLQPYLCSINVYWNGISLEKVKEARFEENELSKYLLQKGDLLICEGGDVGRSSVWEHDVTMYYQNALHRVRFYQNINPYFYKYLIECYKGIGIIDRFSKGVTIKHLVQNSLNAMWLPLPPLAEQKRIVAKIEELLPLVDRYEQAWSKLEQFNNRFPEDMKKSLLQYAIQGKLVEQRPEEGTAEELFAQIQKEKQRLIAEKKIKKEKPLPEITEDEKPFDIPESWKWVRVGSLLHYIDTGKSFKCDEIPPTNDKCGIIKVSAVTWGQFKENESKTCYSNDLWVDEYAIHENDFLICRANTAALVGGCVIVDQISKRLMLSDKVLRLHFSKMLYSYYVLWALRTPMVRNQFSAAATGTSESMKNISQDIIKNTLIPLPPLAEQKRIVEKLEQLLPLCERLK